MGETSGAIIDTPRYYPNPCYMASSSHASVSFARLNRPESAKHEERNDKRQPNREACTLCDSHQGA